MNPTGQKIAHFLAQFDTADEFRTYCQGQGITGVPVIVDACLVAVALQRAFALDWVCVDGNTACVEEQDREIPLPAPIRHAIDAFDCGEWPELYTKDAKRVRP